MVSVNAELLVYEKAKKILSRLLSVRDDLVMFLVQESDVLLSTRMSDLNWGRHSARDSLITPRTALHESIVAA